MDSGSATQKSRGGEMTMAEYIERTEELMLAAAKTAERGGE